MANPVPRGAILRLLLRVPNQPERKRWCVVLTASPRQDTPRFGVVPLSQSAPANELHPTVVANNDNHLAQGEWRARVSETFTAHPNDIIGGHKVSVELRVNTGKRLRDCARKNTRNSGPVRSAHDPFGRLASRYNRGLVLSLPIAGHFGDCCVPI